MFCNKCGNQIPDGAQVCNVCGAAVTVTAKDATAQPEQQYQYYNTYTEPPRKKKNHTGIIVTVIAIFMIAAIAIGGWFLFLSEDALFPILEEDVVSDSEDDENKEENTEGYTGEENPGKDKSGKDEAGKDESGDGGDIEYPAQNTIDPITPVNELIASSGLTNDVAVAIVDNNTDKLYSCNGYNTSYTSWGFYLPVYMAFCDKYPDSYDNYKADIMSHDAGKCNSAANFAISAFGGPAGITTHLQDNYGCSVTSYGRNFGDVNATSDNYTCAREAAAMMNIFNKESEYTKMCYNPATFGVTPPPGATMYAQFGTENRSVKNNLDVFAIMKGTQSDYCVAILTKNKACANGFVDTLLATIHTAMEGGNQ